MSARKRRWIKASVIAGALVALPYLYVAWWGARWWDGAESAVAGAVAAIARGNTPENVALRVEDVDELRLAARHPYQTEGADNYIGGEGIMNLVAGGVYVAHLRFPDSAEYHVEAWREGRRWQVVLATAED